MLREILAVRQDRPELRRRWFQDEFFDLYTWQAHSGTIAGFQLCYDLGGRERALTWRRDSGFSHHRVDHGRGASHYPATPLLAAEGRFPHRFVRTRFNLRAVTLDATTRKFILDKMREFGRHAARGEIVLPRRARTQPPDAQPD
jgi:hypothetical protein